MTEPELAKQWGCNLRTLQRWKKAGAPLNDSAAMRAWLMERGRVPATTATILAGGTARAVPPPTQKNSAKPARRILPTGRPSDLEQGAAAALKRLESAETAAFEEVEALLKDPDADAVEIEAARAAWLKISESLRRYDLAIEQARRDSGSLVPRETMEAYGQGLAINFIGSLRASLESAVPRLAGLPTPAAVWQILAPVLTRATAEAIKNAAERPYKGQQAPDWLVKAITEAASANL